MKKAVTIIPGDIVRIIANPDPRHSESEGMIGSIAQIIRANSLDGFNVRLPGGNTWNCKKESLEVIQKNLIDEGGEK